MKSRHRLTTKLYFETRNKIELRERQGGATESRINAVSSYSTGVTRGQTFRLWRKE
jgi:hypothetical protein